MQTHSVSCEEECRLLGVCMSLSQNSECLVDQLGEQLDLISLSVGE